MCRIDAISYPWWVRAVAAAIPHRIRRRAAEPVPRDG
jgi:hypothetical protein